MQSASAARVGIFWGKLSDVWPCLTLYRFIQHGQGRRTSADPGEKAQGHKDGPASG